MASNTTCIWVIESGRSYGAIGPMVVTSILREAGYAALTVRLDKKRGTSQVPFNCDWAVSDHILRSGIDGYPKPNAIFISMLFPRQYLHLKDTMQALGIPPARDDRSSKDPLIVIGGSVTMAPAPLEPFADVIAIGDGEITAHTMARLAASGKRNAIDAAREFNWTWHPGKTVTVAREADLGARVVFPGRTSKGAATIEVSRGCRHRCPFCCVGWSQGRYREISAADLLGLRKIASCNYFSADASGLSSELKKAIAAHGAKRREKDTRFNDNSTGPDIPSYIGIDGQSERLRSAFGKPIPHSKIVDWMGTCRAGNTKWYVILGVPGETEDDAEEFKQLLRDVRKVYKGMLNVTVTLFQAVPHTPLGCEPNHFDVKAAARGESLRELARQFWNDSPNDPIYLVSQPKGKVLHETDAVLQRGDARVGDALLSRHFDVSDAVSADALGRIEPAASPWRDVNMGVSLGTLARARAKYFNALEGAIEHESDTKLPKERI